MKPCFKCGATLPLDDFYRHPNMPDGHLNKCKECTKRDVRANRRAKLDYYRQYDARRFNEDPTRRAKQYSMAAHLRRAQPDKYRARTAVSNALRDGRLQRQPCEVCGATKVEAHHDDYSRPLAVRWLCVEHHNAAHHSAA
jgi:hypothetical protein